MVTQPQTGAQVGLRRPELLASLSLAIDLGLGQPMEHMLRSCLIALRLAEAAGLDRPDLAVVFYTDLVAWIGCHADSHQIAETFGDDIDFRRHYYRAGSLGAWLGAGTRESGRP